MYSVRHAMLFSVYVQFYRNAHFQCTTCGTILKGSFQCNTIETLNATISVVL